MLSPGLGASGHHHGHIESGPGTSDFDVTTVGIVSQDIASRPWIVVLYQRMFKSPKTCLLDSDCAPYKSFYRYIPSGR